MPHSSPKRSDASAIDMTERLSPNNDARPEATAIDMLILHYTGMKTAEDALARMCDPESKVSAHYVVDEDGSVIRMVPEEMRAWHAGLSYWRGRERLNDNSIGIEIVNPGHEFGYRAFPEAQIASVITLCKAILARHPRITARNVVGHSDVAPSRKEDPGELFPWDRLAANGIGLWAQTPEGVTCTPVAKLGDSGLHVEDFQQRLADFGYSIKIDGNFGAKSEFVVRAFQRHFDPHNLSGIWTECSDALLRRLQQLAKTS